MNKKVSILIPSYMQASFLDEALTSAINQTIPAHEIIVLTMDEKSDDKMNYLTQTKIPNLTWLSTPRKYPPTAKNYMIEKSSGTHFIILNACDKLEPNFIEETSKIDAPIVYTDIEKFGATNKRISSLKDICLGDLKYVNYVPYCSLVSKTVWEEIDGYHEDLRYLGDDWEFWLNLCKQGYKFIWTGDTYFWNRIIEDTLIARDYNGIFEVIAKIHAEIYK